MTSSVISFLKRKILPGFKIPMNATVIDIGSGDKPFWRANVFYDNLSLGDIQRITHDQTVKDIGFFVNNASNFNEKCSRLSISPYLYKRTIYSYELAEKYQL